MTRLPASQSFLNSLWFGRGVFRITSAFSRLWGPIPSRPAVSHTYGSVGESPFGAGEVMMSERFVDAWVLRWLSIVA